MFEAVSKGGMDIRCDLVDRPRKCVGSYNSANNAGDGEVPGAGEG